MIFSQFNSDDIVVGKINQVSSGLFGSSNNLYASQSLFTTSSTQAGVLIGANQFDVRNGQYYTNVYYDNQLYFSVAYGDYENSGSSQYNSDAVEAGARTYTNESKVIYSQFRNMLLQPGDSLFTFASGSSTSAVEGEAIFALTFAADKMKDQIDPGQFQINFRGYNGKDVSFIDDSLIVNKKQNVYNLIRGSIVNGVPTPELVNGSPVYEGVGLLYPSNGIVIFNSINLDKVVRMVQADTRIQTRPSNNTSTEFRGKWRIWMRYFLTSFRRSRKSMAVRKSEFVPSTNYFVRVKNREFNYTNNPTFVSDGTDGLNKGTIVYQELIDNPRTYITTVGLYNANNELLAVGKISKPVQKSFDNELLIKVRIDF